MLFSNLHHVLCDKRVCEIGGLQWKSLLLQAVVYNAGKENNSCPKEKEVHIYFEIKFNFTG